MTESADGELIGTDVVVVGAGLSGLTAARALHRQGFDVLVVEAAARVGGRTMRERSPLGSHLDLGGQWIGHDHHRVRELADELGLRLFPMHTGGLPTVVRGNRRIRFTSPAMVVVAAAIAVAGVLARIEPTGRWSARSVETWLRRVPGRTARRLLEVVALISWTADLDRFSVGAMAAFIRSQGGVRNILSTSGGAQEALLVEGAGALAERLADELGPLVRTGERVIAIRRADNHVTVRTISGEFRARRAIVSVPAPVAARIAHEPPLPEARVALERRTYMGSVYKAIAVYGEPFWRAAHAGELIVLDRPGMAVFDTTPPGGPGHLCLLVGGPEARALDHLDPLVRRTRLLTAIAAHMGAGILEPASWHEKAWHLDEHAGGGYTALPEPGSTIGHPPFPSEPLGRVHWAGAETACDHPGYLDGAIEAGLRAAAEVATSLAPHTTSRVARPG